MQILALFLIGLYVMYALFAVRVGFRLWRERRPAFDDHFTARDRRLVGAATFYLLVPFAVALHELGHAALTWGLGGHITDWGYLLYGGYVVPAREPPFAPLEHAWIAATGNLVTLAMGFGAVLWATRRPGSAAWNFMRLELGRILLWITLFFYPILSLALSAMGSDSAPADKPIGDFAILRVDLNEVAPHLGNAAIGAYAMFALFVWYKWRGPWRARYVWLASPLFDRLRAATRKLEQSPDDVRALMDIGRVFLAGNEAAKAVAVLDRAVELRPHDPEVRYLVGTARLALGQAREASEHLRVAGSHLEESSEAGEQAELRYEVTLALAGARLAMGDAEGAVLTAEAAREIKPMEPRSLLVHADALVAAGRASEARGKLEAGLDRAQGALANEIRRRLRTLAE
ncbi:MAG: tetratricopeptide repeat protein [Myxococcota bacterium]